MLTGHLRVGDEVI